MPPDFPDWQARAAAEAADEQRRHPRAYPLTREEQRELDYDPKDDPHCKSKHYQY